MLPLQGVESSHIFYPRLCHWAVIRANRLKAWNIEARGNTPGNLEEPCKGSIIIFVMHLNKL